MKRFFVYASLLCFTACTQHSNNNAIASKDSAQPSADPKPEAVIASATEIMARPQVPVLCYHHIRPISASESESMKSYSVTPAAFAEQMKVLSDSGYHTILPDELYAYLAFGKALPSKPIMLTFDDTDLEQFTIGSTEMKKYHYKGVFFIMTISIGRPRYMSKDQLKELAADGNSVQGHTWDHHMVTKYTAADWDKQLDEANKNLEKITGQKIDYFAYPFGLWNMDAVQALKARHIKMAFQLSTKRDSTEPLYTVRRMIVPGIWSTQGMLKAMHTTFSR